MLKFQQIPIVRYLNSELKSAFITFFRTYTYNDRRYGHYQPSGYGLQYPGQKLPNQYPQGVPLGEDKFRYDPVSNNYAVRIQAHLN